MLRDLRTFGRRVVAAVKAGASSPQMLGEITASLRENADAIRRLEGRLDLLLEEARHARLQTTWLQLGPERVFEFQYEDWPIRMYLAEGPDDFIEREILRGRTFYQADTLAELRGLVDFRGGTVVDVGANIGNHAVYFGRVCGARRIIAFEPMKKLVRSLSRNLELNGIEADVRQVAISAVEGTGHSIINPTNAGGSGFFVGYGDVPAKPLDAIDLPSFEVLKIDVEGTVADVLKGAKTTISRNRPQVIVEAFDFQFADIDQLLTSYGYRRIGSAQDDHVYAPA